MSSIFRNVMRKDMFIKKETLMSISRLTQKVWVEALLLKKIKMITTKKHGRIIFVICQCVFLIGFIVFFF